MEITTGLLCNKYIWSMELCRLRAYFQVHNLNLISNKGGLNGFDSYKVCFVQRLEWFQIQEQDI